ncbi:MAG: phosphopantetheine-binding protein, partial [Verrucomicrobiota bacterium]
LAREEKGDKRLVGYFIAAKNPAPTTEELRVFLKQKLPDHMVPSAFVALDQFPLNANGKVDRHALPEPEESVVESTAALVAPQNETEQKLFEIWHEVLGQNRFGTGDNFFALGGHSLLATRVASRIAEKFQIQFSLRTIFEFPTIASLAVAVGKAPRDTAIPQPQLARRTKGAPLKSVDQFGKDHVDDLLRTSG